MFSTKNISPRQLSFLQHLLLAIPYRRCVVFVVEKSWIWAVGILLVILGGVICLISFVLERFIYRKIKLIYKFIYQTKATKKEETYYKYILRKKALMK